MRALAIECFGEPTVFQTVELPTPDVAPHHVVIRVVATSVSPVDVKIREGIACCWARFSRCLLDAIKENSQ